MCGENVFSMAMTLASVAGTFAYAFYVIAKRGDNSATKRVEGCTALIVHPSFVVKQRNFENEIKLKRQVPSYYENMLLRQRRRQTQKRLPRLPFDIAPGCLLQYLSAEDLCNLSTVSRSWYLLSIQDQLWAHLLFKQFKTDLTQLKLLVNTKQQTQRKVRKVSPPYTAKGVYRELHRAQKALLREAYMLQAASTLHMNWNVPVHLALELLQQR